MSRAQTLTSVRELPATLGDSPPKGWDIKDAWPWVQQLSTRLGKEMAKVKKLQDIVSTDLDPGERFVNDLFEVGAAGIGGFANPFVVGLLGEDWQQLEITEDFAIDVEAITAALALAAGLGMHAYNIKFGKWVLEGGKGAIAAYLGHIGRKLGAEMALDEDEAAAA